MELRLHQIAEILQSGRKLQAEAPGTNAYYQYTLLTYQIVWLDETFAIVCFAGHQQSGSLTEYQLWSAQYQTLSRSVRRDVLVALWMLVHVVC